MVTNRLKTENHSLFSTYLVYLLLVTYCYQEEYEGKNKAAFLKHFQSVNLYANAPNASH